MTDSMKFGPEWLRNLSADTTNPSSGGNIIASSALQAAAGRNMFPEFRYGREEMLSLFDKNCNMPDILPSYKKIFVEKVQYPLALTPSNDEEMSSSQTVPPNQRSSWLQRSPVGFNSTSRGAGRGGSVDRGRMRGKSIYHPVYQRPSAMFEEDLRPGGPKSERGWSERNGAGDTLVTSAIGCSASGADWNGTPASSPRKEFSSHSRNLENWRRNRHEEGAGDTSTGIAPAEGWRGGANTHGFSSTNRWVRSTSWRDDDVPTTGADGSYGGGGGSATMQRSYSNISTITERGGYIPANTLSKSSQNCRNTPTSVNIGSHTSRGIDGEDNLPEWAMENPSDSGGTFDASGAFHGSIDEDDDRRKQKRQRNISTSSNDSTTYSEKNETADKSSSPAANKEEIDAVSLEISKSAVTTQMADLEVLQVNETQLRQQSVVSPVDVIVTKSQTTNINTSNVSLATARESPSTQCTDIDSKNTTKIQLPIQQQQQQPCGDVSDHMREVADDMVEKLIMDDDSNDDNDFIKQNCSIAATSNAASTSTTGITVAQNSFVSPVVAAMLKQSAQQQQEIPPHHSVVMSSASLPAIVGPTGQKVLPLYGGGIAVDHTILHQQQQQQHHHHNQHQQHHHQLQQQQQQQQHHQLAIAAAASTVNNLPNELNATASTDLWYYRDPQSKVQGPFSAIEMTEWYRAGYFNENLYVRRVCDAGFRSLGDLIKLCHGNMPFTHSHLIPLRLDNLHMANMATELNDKPSQQVLNDFGGIKQQQQQQHQNDFREELKGNVTAAADSLSAAVKNLITAVDIEEILHMHFQMLQEQYLRRQEIVIVTELTKNEAFLQLSPSDRAAVVRQKVHIDGLPEYLTSLSGLSNCLATLNPAAGLQLYDAITECTKKSEMFAAAATNNPQYSQTKPLVNSFVDPNDFVLNAQQQSQQHQQQPQQSSPFSASYVGSGLCQSNDSSRSSSGVKSNHRSDDLLTDLNLRMLMRDGNLTNTSSPQNTLQQKPQEYMRNERSNEFLTEQQLIAAAAATQSPIMQMWMPAPHHQQQIITQQIQAQTNHNQWVNGPLVGIPTAVMSSVQKPQVPASMWDLGGTPMEHIQIMQQQQLNNPINLHEHNLQLNQQQHLQIKEPLQQQKLQQQQDQTPAPFKEIDDLILMHQKQQQQQQQDHDNSAEHQAAYTLVVSKREERSDKQQQQYASKRNNNKPQITTAIAKGKDNIKTEEDRRREAAEEKRRQKEDRKRQQAEEERRRLQQIEDEKRRQLLEEKERQQQIQAQRRKAMLGSDTSSSIAFVTNATTTTNIVKVGNKDRLQTSVAPWSSQITAAAAKGGPCLAEIQKAERRERRADQQRQLEVLEKQIRANAAAAEANDAILKWNASPVPVKSFAEIQAEEAKRLASEQLDMQRRREQEQQQHASVASVGGGVGVTSAAATGSGLTTANNISAIWGGTKVWGATSNTTGFWEEPVKFSSAVLQPTITFGNNKQTQGALQTKTAPITITSTFVQQKMDASNANRNLRKSQTVSVMQNNEPSTSTIAKNFKNNNLTQQSSIMPLAPPPPTKSNAKTQQKSTDIADKKLNAKNQLNPMAYSNNAAAAASKKKDDLENEFTGWCTTNLTQMNTKVDVPTFVTFLQDLESPYEVKDYIRMYLGESKEYTDFAKQFLERRSKYKNVQRAQNAHNDDMCKPAPAITPSGNDNTDCKGKQKKVKKSKMTKLDARILGFSVTAAEGRINVGDRDYVDAQ